MRPQWQRFQQQQQKLQQQRMQQAAWQEQQKAKQAIEAQESEIRAAAEAEASFSVVEKEAARLRKQFKAGKLSLEALQAKLWELMVQDANGVWWMVGTESGRWYRYDGANWQPGTPPRGMPGLPGAKKARRSASAKRGTVQSFFISLFGFAVTAFFTWAAWWISYYYFEPKDIADPELPGFFIAGAVALIGVAITSRKADEAKRSI